MPIAMSNILAVVHSLVLFFSIYSLCSLNFSLAIKLSMPF
jgi:hypothetical protein